MKKLSIFSVFVLVCLFVPTAPAQAAPSDWTALTTGVTTELSEISCPDPLTCYVVAGLYRVGGTGGIIKTTDGGTTFTTLTIPTSNPLHAITCPSAKTCFAGGDFGTLLKTENGGESWAIQGLGSKSNPPEITGMLAVDESRVFVVGKDAFIYRSTDGGATWVPPSLRSVADFFDAHFTDKDTGFITGNDGAMLRTTDGGETWKSRGSLSAAGSITAMRSITGGKTLYAAGTSVSKSTDGGETWTTLATGDKESARAIALSGELTAYILTGSNAVLKTTDGGATWNSDFSTSTNAVLRSVVCPKEGYCIAVGSGGKAFRLGTPPPTPVVVATTTVAAAAVATTTPAVAAVTPSKAELEAELQKTLALVAALTSNTKKVNPAPAEPAVSAKVLTITQTLKKGAKGDEVKRLQELLAGVGGVYPEATVNGTYGPATSKAVGRFQEKYGIVKNGEKGYGEVGPKTRAKLIEAAKGLPEETSTTPLESTETTVAPAKTPRAAKEAFTRTLKKGTKGDDVKKLQELLSLDAEVYPEGLVNGTFGPATAKAIGRFQEKHGIVGPGDVGYAEAGPKTQKKLIELSQ